MRFNILSVVAVSALSALVSASYSQCKSLPKSCATRANEAGYCTSLFLKGRVKRPTCTSTPPVTTVTRRVTPTTTSVLVVTSTSTTFVTHAQSDVLVTETHEAVVSSTSVVTESVDETITTTITSTSTTVPGSSCTQAPVPRDIFDPLAGGNVFRKRGGLPACCSACFLTSTKIAPRKTTTVTATQPKVTARITSTRTTTITSAVNLLANTETLFETSTSTFVSTSTITTTSTHTSTETTTVTALPPSLCGSPFTFNGNNAFSYTGTVASNDGDGITNISDCCTKCYTITNCANFMFDTNANTCTIFVMNSGTPSDRCVNDVCPFGHGRGTFMTRPNNEKYSPGPCGGGIVRIN